MKKHVMPEMKEGGVNVTPLIDIVMCLIIFFMLVAKIGVSTGSTPMDLPTTIVGKKIEQLGDNVILNVYDPNIERENNQSEGRPLRDDKGQVIRTRGLRQTQPRVTLRLSDKDREPTDVPLERRLVGASGVAGYPLRETLAQMYSIKKAKGLEKSFSVTLRAERDLPYGMLQNVLFEIAQAGVRNVNYASTPKTEVVEPGK